MEVKNYKTVTEGGEAVEILVLRDNAKDQLMNIKSVDDALTYFNKLKSIDVWVKAEKKDAELQNLIAEQKLRTQRILGELIKKGQEDGDIRKPTENQFSASSTKQLADIGLNKKQSSTFQQIASIPAEDFEEFIAEKKEVVNNAVAELTTAGAVRLAKTLSDKKEGIKVRQDLQERLEVEKELKDLAHHINMTYTKDQRLFFITQIK